MHEKDKILVVDDEQSARQFLADILSDDGFHVFLADNGERALKLATAENFMAILLDINMPGMSGIEICRNLKAQDFTRGIPIIFISGTARHKEKMEAFSSGGVDFIAKPFQIDELLARVHTHLELNHLRAGLESKVEERTRELREALKGTIQTLALVIENRDPYTAGHQRNVADLACVIASEMELRADQRESLRMAGLIHDIGKISIPAEILSMPRKLTEIEYSLLKTHVQSGFSILKDIKFPWPIARMVLEHHERIDGSGYPDGIKGEDLLLESRILAVADVVDAAASFRPYRPAQGIDYALEEIAKGRGILYDSAAADVCVNYFRKTSFIKKPTRIAFSRSRGDKTLLYAGN